MNHIAADVHSQIATDGARLSLERLGGTDELASASDHTIAFSDHGHHRTRCDEIDQAGKEGALLMNAVVLFG